MSGSFRTRILSLAGKVLFLPLCVILLAGLSGCRDEESDRKSGFGQETSGKGVDDSRFLPGEAGGSVGQPGVYPLTTPEAPASEEERNRAQAVVDFANDALSVVADGACGVYPIRIMQAVTTYHEQFVAPEIPGDRPPLGCASHQTPVPQSALFGSNTGVLVRELSAMDLASQSMQKDYQALRNYVQDAKIRDDGKKGEKLVSSIRQSYAVYSASRTHFLDIVNRAAEEAQDVLLKNHPLRAQVAVARRLFSDFREAADLIGATEPDPETLGSVLGGIEQELTTGERLPFSIAGEVEMTYRQYLKSARMVQGCMRRGILESFTPSVRLSLNEHWNDCLSRYNAFIDAAGKIQVARQRQ